MYRKNKCRSIDVKNIIQYKNLINSLDRPITRIFLKNVHLKKGAIIKISNLFPLKFINRHLSINDRKTSPWNTDTTQDKANNTHNEIEYLIVKIKTDH